MNSIDLRLLELLQDAETPLYSAYRWVDKQFEDKLSLPAFLELVDDMLDRDVVELRRVDPDTYEDTWLASIPTGLANEYAAVPELDDVFDPFGLSLKVGAAAPVRARPDWKLDIDFERGRFVMSGEAEVIDVALAQASRLFVPARFVAQQRSVEGTLVRIEGVVVDGAERTSAPDTR